MGGWKLEVFRIGCYVSMPVFCFYMYNSPELFQEHLKQHIRYYAPDLQKPPNVIHFNLKFLIIFSFKQKKKNL
jgi:hypothetical protein